MQGTLVHELRLESRSNVFVMAALYADGRSGSPVRVRNISSTGALIEGAALPPIGTAVQLSRASLKASGSVMWVEQGKAGLQFDVPIAVTDWLPQGRRGFGQQFVDEVFHQKRLGISSARSESTDDKEASFPVELLALRLSLERAVETLALDRNVATRHAATLQSIDCVGQGLARLAKAAGEADAPMATCRRTG